MPRVPSGETLPAHQYKLSQFSSALAAQIKSASSDSPQSLLSTPGTPVVYEGKSCLGSQFVASPPLCVQLLQSVSLFQPLSDSDWSGGNLVPDAAGSQ